MINIIYPSLPGTKTVDPFWEKESQAAEAAGFGISTVTDQNERGPLVVRNQADSYLYRGWLVKPDYYQELSTIACPIVTSYEDYMWTRNFPDWYKAIAPETPNSLIITGDEVVSLGLTGIADQVDEIICEESLILKDYLKSRKHEWYDACFIKDSSDKADVIRVMTNFFNLQGRDFYGGLVFRRFLELKKLGVHPKSGMPLPIEFRTFFLNQRPLVTSMYWNNDIAYPENVEQPPQDWLEEIGKKMKSPFVALDIAQDVDDQWWVIEVNDGGTAGYPDNLDSNEFYSLLYKGLSK
jgi:ATP-grasp domain, R2K clade family 3